MKVDIKVLALSIIMIAVTIASSVMYFGHTRAIDAQSYIQLSYFLQGKDGQLLEHFASRPLVPALAAVLNQFFDITKSFGIVNVVFLCLTSLLLFALFSELFNDIKLGFFSALLYPLSFPIILLGSQVLTDAAGYFFLVLGIYFIEYRFKKLNLKNFIFAGIIIGLGLLVRDSLFILFIYLFFTILIDRHKYLKKKFSIFYKVFLTLLIAVLPFALWKYFTNVRSYPILERIRSTIDKIFSLKYFSTFIVRSMLAFHILWLPAIHGFIIDKDKKRRLYYYKILLTILPLIAVAYLTLAQNYNYDLRHTFALFPIVLPLAAYSLMQIDKKLNSKNLVIIGFILLYAVISFFGAYFVPDSPIRDSLIDIKFIEKLFSLF